MSGDVVISLLSLVNAPTTEEDSSHGAKLICETFHPLTATTAVKSRDYSVAGLERIDVMVLTEAAGTTTQPVNPSSQAPLETKPALWQRYGLQLLPW